MQSSMWNAGLDESQAGPKIAGRNIKKFRYADDINTTLMAESEEELKSFLIRVKEESEKTGLKLSIQKTKIMTPVPITSWQIERQKMEVVTDFIFLNSKITADVDGSLEIKRCLLLGRKAMINLDTILKSRDITLLTKVVVDVQTLSCLTFCYLVDCSTPGSLHCLLKFAQIPVHWVDDAM